MHSVFVLLIATVVLMIGNGQILPAQDSPEIDGEVQDKPESVQPQPREDDWWQNRHTEKLKTKNAMEKVDLLLIGDSITHGWENDKAKKVWDEHFSDYRTLNLGYSGDRTEHVLWRLHNDEVEGISPKLAVIMIGTNNTGHRKDKPEDIALGIKSILDQLKVRLPETKLLLLAIFPRDRNADGELRAINNRANELIKEFADDHRVWFLDINDQFLTDDKTLSPEIMPDALHPNEAGYKIWATAMKEKISELMK